MSRWEIRYKSEPSKEYQQELKRLEPFKQTRIGELQDMHNALKKDNND